MLSGRAKQLQSGSGGAAGGGGGVDIEGGVGVGVGVGGSKNKNPNASSNNPQKISDADSIAAAIYGPGHKSPSSLFTASSSSSNNSNSNDTTPIPQKKRVDRATMFQPSKVIRKYRANSGANSNSGQGQNLAQGKKLRISLLDRIGAISATLLGNSYDAHYFEEGHGGYDTNDGYDTPTDSQASSTEMGTLETSTASLAKHRRAKKDKKGKTGGSSGGSSGGFTKPKGGFKLTQASEDTDTPVNSDNSDNSDNSEADTDTDTYAEGEGGAPEHAYSRLTQSSLGSDHCNPNPNPPSSIKLSKDRLSRQGQRLRLKGNKTHNRPFKSPSEILADEAQSEGGLMAGLKRTMRKASIFMTGSSAGGTGTGEGGGIERKEILTAEQIKRIALEKDIEKLKKQEEEEQAEVDVMLEKERELSEKVTEEHYSEDKLSAYVNM